MKSIAIIGIALVVAGAAGLIYGEFSYTRESTAVKLGTLELSVKQKETVNIPMWAGIGAIVAGAVLFGIGGKKG